MEDGKILLIVSLWWSMKWLLGTSMNPIWTSSSGSSSFASSITEIGPRGNLPTSDAVNKLIISEG